MKYDQAKRAVKLAMGWSPNPDVVEKAAKAISDEGENVMLPHELRRRLQSFVARCANSNIKTLGEYLIHPILKV